MNVDHLDKLFNDQSIAFVIASYQPSKEAKWCLTIIRMVITKIILTYQLSETNSAKEITSSDS